MSSDASQTDELRARVKAKADSVAAELRARCLAMPKPSPLSVFDNVSVEPNPVLERQRSQYAAYLDTFEGDED